MWTGCNGVSAIAELVMLRYIKNIEISIRYRYMVSYRIIRGNIDFLIIVLPNFHVLRCQEVVKLSLKPLLSVRFNESFNKNFTTSWHHTWKFGKRITKFFIVRKFREILHYYLLVRISKAVISRRGPSLAFHRSVKMHISITLNKLDCWNLSLQNITSPVTRITIFARSSM